MDIFLNKFLLEGKLGQIYVGQNRVEAFHYFGIPAEFHRGTSVMDAEVWINGIVTIWFEDGVIIRIGLYFILEYRKNNNLKFNGYFPKKGVLMEEVISYLEAEEISYEKVATKIGRENLVTKCGTEIVFSSNSVSSIVFPKVNKV